MKKPGYPIRLVSRRTGLSAHVIRAWEKRYGAVDPNRSGTNRRLYTEEDVERLMLLKRATDLGHSISQIARLPTDQLRALLPALLPTAQGPAQSAPLEQPEVLLKDCLEALEMFDSQGLDNVLARASVALSQPVLIESLLVPFLERVGELWRSGHLRVSHEHLATASVRTLLGALRESFQVPAGAPTLIATTPVGQFHELGALIVSLVGAAQGWRTVYLGCNTPAAEIAAAAARSRARLVALSINYPPDDPALDKELRLLRKHLSNEISILAGGRSASAYRHTLEEIGAIEWSPGQTISDLLAARRSPASLN